MILINSSDATKKLVLRFILDNVDYRKRCVYLQEIIAMGRIKKVWKQALLSFLDTPMEIDSLSLKVFSKN
jgi:hypothetical protein